MCCSRMLLSSKTLLMLLVILIITTTSLLRLLSYETFKQNANVKAGDIREDANSTFVHVNSTTNKTMLIVVHCPPRVDCERIYQEDRTKFKHCHWSDCELSAKQDRTADATIILYQADVLYPKWPEIRFANQTYIHVMEERPCRELWWLAKYDDKINLTWNYRDDADISIHPIVKKKDKPKEGRYIPRIPLSNKTKSVVWAVSHCNADSRRDEYVAELSKYIDVDTYGKCGTLICPQEKQDECADQWERAYKFYLAFENAVCKDYVTEKLFRTLHREMIPVVLGGADYSKACPPHSCINVKDYNSPKELAAYLHHLSQNEEEYYEYFQWKQSYFLGLNGDGYCKLCEIAHNTDKWARPAYHEYYSWYMNVCQNELVEQMRRNGNW